MKLLTQLLTEITNPAFEKCGYDGTFGAVLVSDRMDLCQFQCNGAFACSKQYRKAPSVIANEVASVLRENPVFQNVGVAGPGFINLTLTDEFLLNCLSEIAEDAHAGIPQEEKPETVVLDFGGPNVAKPLHIGHLRSAIIGEAIKRIARAAGRNVIGDIHLGDWGLQIGLVIAELEERNPEWCCFSSSFDPDKDSIPELNIDTLNELYPFASKKSKADLRFKQKADRVTSELQTGHKGYYALWKEIMRVSVSDLRENYKKLNVEFDLWLGESDSEKYVEPLLSALKGRGLLYESDGAQVVDVAESSDSAPVPPVIIKKTDNSNIYATTDLATILERQKDFAPDEIWYVVDKRQSLHFTQIFRCAKKAALVPQTTELLHLGFGTMNGSDGKPYKTREGGVMRLSDLLDTVIGAARRKLEASTYDSEEDIDEKARKIAIAAIKFGDLINHRTKDYVFDIDKFLSFEGKTGTYLLYTVTRIHSILKKADTDGREPRFSGVYSEAERNLILTILLSAEAFTHALQEKAPNYVCDNAYKLANAFSTFYHDNYILSEQDVEKRSTWLALCKVTEKMLNKHLDMLGIESVESM